MSGVPEGINCVQCGMWFSVPQGWLNARRSDCKVFYCPNGHKMSYTVSSETKLRVERDALQRAKETSELHLQSKINEANHARLVAEKAFESERRKRRKIEKRVANGVCPCCNRTFEDLARHMSTKHKDYALPPAAIKQIEGSVQ